MYGEQYTLEVDEDWMTEVAKILPALPSQEAGELRHIGKVVIVPVVILSSLVNEASDDAQHQRYSLCISKISRKDFIVYILIIKRIKSL